MRNKPNDYGLLDQFPPHPCKFRRVGEMVRSDVVCDSGDLKMVDVFLGKKWNQVNPVDLKLNFDAFYFFSDEAYYYYIPAILNCALMSFDDAAMAIVMMFRDIVDDGRLRSDVFFHVMTPLQRRVFVRIFDDSGFLENCLSYLYGDELLLARARIDV